MIPPLSTSNSSTARSLLDLDEASKMFRVTEYSLSLEGSQDQIFDIGSLASSEKYARISLQV